MTIPSSGPVTFTDIQTEFGGTNPIALNEYYAGGGLVPAGTTGTYGAVPSSGQISVQNFYGTTAFTPVYIEEVFSTYLYTGTGATQTITNGIDLSAKGGLVWIKDRSNAESHSIWDTARGVSAGLQSNATSAQYSDAISLTAYNSNGFSLGADSNVGWVNRSPDKYVSWTFREQPKFFDVVTYTGTGSAGQFVPHNLQANYGFAVIKRTDSTSDWWVLAKESSAASYWAINLNSTAAYTNLYGADPNLSTGFYPSSFNGGAYTNGATYVAYLFAASSSGGFGLAGTDSVVSCGTYIGTGTVGLAVTLGYEPQWVMIKRVFGVGNWTIFDNMRGMPVGSADTYLYANSSAAEASAELISPTATGFTIQSTVAGINDSGDYYIYIAIRRGPMKVPTVGTTVFNPIARTGTGTNPTVVTTGNNPDLLMSFPRAASPSNYGMLFWDKLRGVTQMLTSSSTAAELATSTTYVLQGWQNTGYQVGADFISGYLNYYNATYINYPITRAPSFFDVVCYTGTGSAQALTHNLTVVPEIIIVKSRSATGAWDVYSSAIPDKAIRLNSTAAQDSGIYLFGFGAVPTASVFSVDGFSIGYANTNASGTTYVAYLFATCAGVSKVGSYTGTGALQTINCGFSSGSRFVLIKRTDSTGGWYVWDSARGISSSNDPYLLLNSTAAEVTGTNYVDTTSVGFQVTAAAPAELNASGGTYLFLAIA